MGGGYSGGDTSVETEMNIRFNVNDAQLASDEWGFNCGPGALCAVLDMTPNEIRPHLLDFESKGYTNPTLMYRILDRLKVRYRQCYRGDEPNFPQSAFPRFGLVRVQWGGRWTNPGVPMRVRYRHTHWIATRGEYSSREVFDVNGVCAGGWLSWNEWSTKLVPWLMLECANKATSWWPTHGLEITK